MVLANVVEVSQDKMYDHSAKRGVQLIQLLVNRLLHLSYRLQTQRILLEDSMVQLGMHVLCTTS